MIAAAVGVHNSAQTGLDNNWFLLSSLGKDCNHAFDLGGFGSLVVQEQSCAAWKSTCIFLVNVRLTLHLQITASTARRKSGEIFERFGGVEKSSRLAKL